MNTYNTTAADLNSNDDFDPMAESTWTPEIVTKEEFDIIKANEQKVISFQKKYAAVRAKYEATFVDGIANESDWTNEDATVYENYLNEKKSIPTDRWNTNQYQIAE